MNNQSTTDSQSQLVRVLHIEDNELDAVLVENALNQPGQSQLFKIQWVQQLRDAQRVLADRDNQFDVILLDLGLPDSTGLASIKSLLGTDPALPIVVLTGLDDPEIGRIAVSMGAEDYLSKSQMTVPGLLQRSLEYAIERQRRVLHEQSLEQVETQPAVRAQRPIGRLKQENIARFDSLVHNYRRILDSDYVAAPNDLSYRINQLLDELIALDAQPEDLLDLYSAALQELLNAKPSQHDEIKKNSRLVALNMMAQFASAFRGHK